MKLVSVGAGNKSALECGLVPSTNTHQLHGHWSKDSFLVILAGSPLPAQLHLFVGSIKILGQFLSCHSCRVPSPCSASFVCRLDQNSWPIPAISSPSHSPDSHTWHQLLCFYQSFRFSSLFLNLHCDFFFYSSLFSFLFVLTFSSFPFFSFLFPDACSYSISTNSILNNIF